MRLTAITAAMVMTAGAAWPEEKTLDIGVSDALTGGGAVYGLPQTNAVKLAAKEINASGGIKVGEDTYMLNVIAYDDKANPTEASNAVRKLIDRDGVKYILGFCCSGATGAVASFIEYEDAVMLVGNAAERSITTREIPNLTRTRPPADYTGAAAGTFVAEKGHKRVAVLGALDVGFYASYVDAFEKELEKAGGEIVSREAFGLKDRLCCTNLDRDSRWESSMIAGGHEQLGPYEVQDQELAFVQHSAEATRIAVDLV